MKGPILRKLESVQFRPLPIENHEDLLKDFLIKDLAHFITEIDNGLMEDTENAQATLNHLPVRVVFYRLYINFLPFLHKFIEYFFFIFFSVKSY